MKSVRGEGAISQDVFGDVFEPAVESFLHSGRYRRLLDIKSKIEVIKGTFEWRCIDDKDYVSLLHEDTSQPPSISPRSPPLPTSASHLIYLGLLCICVISKSKHSGFFSSPLSSYPLPSRGCISSIFANLPA